MDRHDDKKSYCRMLGHAVTFNYCRTTSQNTPCRKIRDCWFETLPIEDYMNTHFNTEEQQLIFKEPAPKITSLLDLIEQARKRAESSGE